MWTRRALAGLVAAGAASAASAAIAGPPSRRAEVEALRRFAETTHPRGRDAAADPRWREGWEQLARQADSLGDGPYAVSIWRLLGWFEDGHTTLLPVEFLPETPAPLRSGSFGYALPLQLRAFDDGLYVVAARNEAAALNGARVMALNGVSDVGLMRRLAEVWTGSPAWRHRWAGLLAGCGMLEGLGVTRGAVDAPVTVEALGRSGALSVAVTPRIDGRKDRVALSRPRSRQEAWAAEAGRGNYLRALPDRDALYVSIDGMEDMDGMSFADLTRGVFAAMEAPGVRRLVIDLRRNGGGDNFLGEALRRRIARSAFNRPGGLYVLVSPQTFSAAQNLANRLERETFAVFVGGPTGGSPNHYGDARTLTGEATGLTAMVSTIPWFDSYPMDRRPWILPDLPVADRFADWVAGHDPALELALAHRPEGETDDLSPSRVFYYARPSQKGDWTPFWRA
jgi:hypothetical protein